MWAVKLLGTRQQRWQMARKAEGKCGQVRSSPSQFDMNKAKPKVVSALVKCVREPGKPIKFGSPDGSTLGSVMSPIRGEWHCIVELSSGERFATAVKSYDEPDIFWLRESFSKTPERFSKVV